jgi:valyl-tRNA synthetase
MPFITEEIWQRLPHRGDSVMIAPYPRVTARQRSPEAERDMGVVISVITAIRTIRGEMRIAPGAALDVTVRPTPEAVELLTTTRPLIEALGRVRLVVDPAATRGPDSALAVVAGGEVYVGLAGVVDLAAERQRLLKELGRVDDTLAFLQAKLGRPEFVTRAPAEVVERERGRLAEQEAVRAKLVASLSAVDDGRG